MPPPSPHDYHMLPRPQSLAGINTSLVLCYVGCDASVHSTISLGSSSNMQSSHPHQGENQIHASISPIAQPPCTRLAKNAYLTLGIKTSEPDVKTRYVLSRDHLPRSWICNPTTWRRKEHLVFNLVCNDVKCAGTSIWQRLVGHAWWCCAPQISAAECPCISQL